MRPANKNDSSEKLSGSVFVFFYNPEREQVLIISKDELQNSEELLDTAEKIYAEKEDFGILKSEDLYYYKQTTPHEIKIAIADRNFIRFASLDFQAYWLSFCLRHAAFLSHQPQAFRTRRKAA